MDITPDIIKKLLTNLVSTKYPELIRDYRVISSEKSDKSDYMAFAIGVMIDPEKYNEMETYTGNPFSGLDSKVENDVKDVLKYIGLGPTNSTVSLFVLDK